MVIFQNTFVYLIVMILVLKVSSHSQLSKYIEIMPWKPPIPKILALIAREGMNGTREIMG